MKNWDRRRVLQAGLAAGGGALLGAAWAQDDRTLQVGPRPAGPAAPNAPSSGSLLATPRRALVIGNSAYAVGPLKNPANDAKAIAELLKKQNFEVTLGLDLKRAEMVEMIGAYGQGLARGNPVALFYFAGHGLQLSWRNYLVPVDASVKSAADVQAQCVDVNAVIEGIGKARNPMNVIILDACRDDPFGSSQQKGLSQLDAPPGTLLAFATSPGNVASDGTGANGLYTENLLREMKVPEATIEDVFKRVRLGVRRRSNGQQIPWESTSLEEDFWFIPPAQLVSVAQDRQRQEAAQQFLQESALWEKTDGSKEPGRLEEYLRRYPSGRFSDLAQLQLDELLRRAGEKPIQIASQAGNPFTQGSVRADIDYKTGNSYTFLRLDRLTREQRTQTSLVTSVTDKEVLFGDGLVLDRLGNLIRFPDGRLCSSRQDEPLEYAVGRKWPSRYTTKDLKQRDWEIEMDHRITGREQVTVRSGTFDCYVIVGEGWSTSDSGRSIFIRWKRWKAPDKVRRPVLSENVRREKGKVIEDVRQELVAFNQA